MIATSTMQPVEMKVFHEEGKEKGEKIMSSDKVINAGTPAEPENVSQESTDSGRQIPSMAETMKAHTDSYFAEEKAEAWSKTEEIIKNYSDDLVAKWHSEIDTLLVYAGLFSAILTAFNVQSYQLLQPPPPDPALAVLERISAQLGSFSVATAFINSTQSPYQEAPPVSPGPTRAAVWLNVLWFSALICSLESASVGIMVKQWLREYSTGLTGSSYQISQLRQYRLNNLVKWRVAGIVSALPILLQLSLTLFLTGLVVLLWTLNRTVAIVATVLVSLLMVFTVGTTVLPAIKPDCCYLSPPTYAIHAVVVPVRRWLVMELRALLLLALRLCGWTRARLRLYIWADRLERLSSSLTPSTWRSQESYLLARKPFLKCDQIVLAYSVTLDSGYLDACARACLATVYFGLPFVTGVLDGIHGVNLTHDAIGMPSWLDTQTLELWILSLLRTCWSIEINRSADAHQSFGLGILSYFKTQSAALEDRKSRLLRYIGGLMSRAEGLRTDGAKAVRIFRMFIPLIPVLLHDENQECRTHAIAAMVDVIIRFSSMNPEVLETWTSARYAAQAAAQVLQCLADHKLTLDTPGSPYIKLLEIMVSCAKLPDTPAAAAAQLRSFALQAIRTSVHSLHGDGRNTFLQRLEMFDVISVPDSLRRLQSIEQGCHQSGEDDPSPALITFDEGAHSPYSEDWTPEQLIAAFDDLPRLMESGIPSILDPSLCSICSSGRPKPSPMRECGTSHQ